MYRKTKFYEISNEENGNIEKKSKAHLTTMKRERKLKKYQIAY